MVARPAPPAGRPACRSAVFGSRTAPAPPSTLTGSHAGRRPRRVPGCRTAHANEK